MNASSCLPLVWFELIFLNYAKKVSIWIRVFSVASHRKPIQIILNSKESLSALCKSSPNDSISLFGEGAVWSGLQFHFSVTLWALPCLTCWLCSLVGFSLEEEIKRPPSSRPDICTPYNPEKEKISLPPNFEEIKSPGVYFDYSILRLFIHIWSNHCGHENIYLSLTISCCGRILLRNLGLRSLPLSTVGISTTQVLGLPSFH